MPGLYGLWFLLMHLLRTVWFPSVAIRNQFVVQSFVLK